MKFYLIIHILCITGIHQMHSNVPICVTGVIQYGLATENVISHNKPIEFYTSFDTTDHVTFYQRALVKEKYGDWQGVLADLNEAIRIKPLPEYYNFRALVNAHLNDFSSAHRDFDQAILLNPNFGTAHYNKGMLYFNQHDKSRACTEMRKASSVNSLDASVFLREFCQ